MLATKRSNTKTDLIFSSLQEVSKLAEEMHHALRGEPTESESIEALTSMMLNVAENLIETANKVGNFLDESRLSEGAKVYARRLEERKKHKVYKMQEDENPYEWDLKVAKKAISKKYPDLTDNEVTIKAASEIAKKNKVTRKEVLSTFKPSTNRKGEKTWDKEGNVITKE